jgi:hypothetical protein
MLIIPPIFWIILAQGGPMALVIAWLLNWSVGV